MSKKLAVNDKQSNTPCDLKHPYDLKIQGFPLTMNFESMNNTMIKTIAFFYKRSPHIQV